MSTIKNPQQKKQLSYNLDRRNAYGANNKNSRKSIRKHKRHNHHRRRTLQNLLHQLHGDLNNNNFLLDVESKVISHTKLIKATSFKKYPDQSLAEHIKYQLEKRIHRFRRKKIAQQRYLQSQS